jgi:CheY-like chemotaxis protein
MTSPLTLLIVDDDADDREMFIEVATEINPSCICVQANNGYEAFQLLNKENFVPEYIFLDLNMPRMNGKQFLENLKKNDRLRSIPVIIYSTSKMDGDKEEMKRLGAAYFITKPSSMETLKKELEIAFLTTRKKNGAM